MDADWGAMFENINYEFCNGLLWRFHEDSPDGVAAAVQGNGAARLVILQRYNRRSRRWQRKWRR